MYWNLSFRTFIYSVFPTVAYCFVLIVGDFGDRMWHNGTGNARTGKRESQPLRKTRLRARVCVCVHACVRVCVRAYLCVCVFVCFWFVQEKTLLCDDICVDGAKERCMMELKILPNKWPDFRNVINDCFSHWNLIPIGSGRVIGCCVTTSVQYSQFEL